LCFHFNRYNRFFRKKRHPALAFVEC
jgi:hypothetical protein